MISIIQFMMLYERYYYKYHCLYIFIIHLLFSFTQSYPLLLVLSINYCCFSSVCLFIVAIGAFVFIYGHCWYLYTYRGLD